MADRSRVDEWVCRTTRRWKRRERVDCVDFGLNAHTRWVSAERKRKLSEPSLTFRELRTFNLRTATHSTAPRERNCCLWYQIAAHNVSGKFNFFPLSIHFGWISNSHHLLHCTTWHGIINSQRESASSSKKKRVSSLFLYISRTI